MQVLKTSEQFKRNEREARKRTNGKNGAGIQYIDYVGGRGSGKTTIALWIIFHIAMEYANQRTFWSARTGKEIDEVLMQELEAKIPQALWRHKTTQNNARYIEWITGHRTALISRNIDNPKRRPGLGFNTMGGVHDEAATGFLLSKFTDINNGIRSPGAPFYFCLTTSTPIANGYKLWCYSAGHHLIFSSSYDSPFLSKANIDSMAAQMDDETVEQELEGKFVTIGGRHWDSFVEKPWPDGNIMEGVEYDPSEPFYLWCDLGGAQGAYQIVQYHEPLHPVTGQKLYNGKIAVIVAEITPNRKTLPEVCKIIIDEFCNGDRKSKSPYLVCVGHDVNAEDKTGPKGSEYFASLGWDFQWPRGLNIRKTAQRQAMRTLICNTKGDRRFCVAAKKNKIGEYEIVKQIDGHGKMRGILNVMRNDVFPEDSDDLFIKDKSSAKRNAIEDDRDAALYGVVINHPIEMEVSDLLPK
jgi:hypothetical protein